MAYELGLHTVFTKLTDPGLRGRSDEAELLEKGRTYLYVFIYSHLCVFRRCAPAPLPSPGSAEAFLELP